jgi:hypothetical protein
LLSPMPHRLPEDRMRSIDAHIHPADVSTQPSSSGNRAWRLVAVFPIIFCLGIAAGLAWQAHGHSARQVLANSFPLLGWLAPQAEAHVQTAPNIITATAPEISPPSDWEHLKAISLGLAAVRQSVEQLAASQQQMMAQIAKVQAAQQEISALQRQTSPASAAKQAPGTPRSSSKASPVR